MSTNNGRLYNLDHCTYICQYHVVWVTKYRGKVMQEMYIKNTFKTILKTIARWKDFKIMEWHIGDEHIHLYIIIPPKYSIAYAIQILKGKSSSWIKKKTKKFPPGSIWARGYFVSTLGINEFQVRNYINNQQHRRIDIPRLPFPSKSEH